MTASTLRQLINEYRRDGFKVTKRLYSDMDRLVIEVTIPKHRAMYKQHIEEFVRLGGFTNWDIENGKDIGKACVYFWKTVRE